jgi:hypothetical protein
MIWGVELNPSIGTILVLLGQDDILDDGVLGEKPLYPKNIENVEHQIV